MELDHDARSPALEPYRALPGPVAIGVAALPSRGAGVLVLRFRGGCSIAGCGYSRGGMSRNFHRCSLCFGEVQTRTCVYMLADLQILLFALKRAFPFFSSLIRLSCDDRWVLRESVNVRQSFTRESIATVYTGGHSGYSNLKFRHFRRCQPLQFQNLGLH